MNPEEYDRLHAVERNHWFYRGKRTIVRRWIERFKPLTPETTLLDVGTGTGLFAEEMSRFCRVTGVDDHEEAISLARRRSGPTFVQAPCNALPFPEGAFDVCTALDVLEHLPDDFGALAEMDRALKPDGIAVVTVPAFMLLWSEWDVVLHHQRRYRRRQVADLAKRAGMPILTCRYINSAMFLPIVAYRKLREWTPLFRGQTRAEDKVPPRWMNRVLESTFVGPACQQWFTPPFGVSVLAVLRKSASASALPTEGNGAKPVAPPSLRVVP